MSASKTVYYVLGWLMIIFSAIMFWSYNLTAFSLLGFVMPFFSLITGIIYFYLGNKGKINLIGDSSIAASIIVWLANLIDFARSMIFTGAYGEITNVVSVITTAGVIAALILAVIGIFYKNKEAR